MTDKRPPAEPGDDYVVGYKRPPRHTRFQPGRSAYPEGRRKGSKNFNTVFYEELAVQVALIENGKRRRMPKSRALIRKTINKALTNDSKAAALVFDQIRRSEGFTNSPAMIDVRQRENKVVMESIVRRIRLGGDVSPGIDNPDDDREESK